MGVVGVDAELGVSAIFRIYNSNISEIIVVVNDDMARDRSNRFNAKGRQSGLNKLKEDQKIKERKRNKAHFDGSDGSDGEDANADMILPKSKEQKAEDQKKKLELRKEVCPFKNIAQLSHHLPVGISTRWQDF